MPIIGVLSVLWSIWLTASVFDLSDSLKDVFLVNFIDIPNVIRLSLQSIVMSASLWFLFHYINYLFKALTKRHFKQKTSNAGNRPNITLANNIIAILVWGAYLVIVMIMLKIPAGAIEIISAGLSHKVINYIFDNRHRQFILKIIHQITATRNHHTHSSHKKK